ncbi:MAG: response regulator [Gemmatimonadota bacterium]
MTALVLDMVERQRTVVAGKGRFDVVLAPYLPFVEADAAQMRQVLSNLITNAVDALAESGGVIGIRTKVMRVDGDAHALPFGQQALLRGTYAVVEVSDNGSGMSAETQARIFDPFFTTKFVGRGLGLASVLGVLRGHGGAIDVQSELGIGSTFRLYLPTLADDAVLHPPGVAPVDRRLEGEAGALILVVDDDAAVRNLATRIISRAGFTVRAAVDGVEAIQLLTELGPKVSLVLLDMVMPRMNGEATLREIRRLTPSLPVLLTSGYSEEVAAHRGAAGGHVAFIQKPYRAASLVMMIRHLLDTSVSAREPFASA